MLVDRVYRETKPRGGCVWVGRCGWVYETLHVVRLSGPTITLPHLMHTVSSCVCLQYVLVQCMHTHVCLSCLYISIRTHSTTTVRVCNPQVMCVCMYISCAPIAAVQAVLQWCCSTHHVTTHLPHAHILYVYTYVCE